MAAKTHPTLIESFDLDAPHVTEARRLLQTLARQHRDWKNPVFVITSAGRGEGKSTISGLLAIVAARIFHRKTLIIDTDIRRPSLHRLMGIRQSPGLAELLRAKGKGPIEPSIVNLGILPTLSMMPCGAVRGPIGALYDDEAFGVLLGRLRPEYDLILVDVAPIVPVVDPLLICEHADGVLVVVMAGKTPEALLRRMREIMDPVAEKISGVILNNASERLPYYYDYRYYGYRPDSREMTRHAASGGDSRGT